MHRNRYRITNRDPRIGRCGFLSLGPLREILLVTMTVGAVLMGVWQIGSSPFVHLRSATPAALARTAFPVRSLNLDQDRQSLVIYSWPDHLAEVHLKTSRVSNRPTPRRVWSVATSERNSTTIMLTKSTEALASGLEIQVIRDDALVISHELPPGFSEMADVRISADGSTALVVSETGLFIGWDRIHANPVQWEVQLNHESNSNSLSPDGCWLFASDGEENAAIYDARTGALRHTLRVKQSCPRTAVWSGNGQRLAVSTNGGGIHVFDTTTGEQIWEHSLKTLFARSLAFSHDGELLAAGGFERQIRVWNLSRPNDHPKTLLEKSSIIQSLVFTQSDRNLACGTNEGAVHEWSLETCQLVRQLR